MGKKQRRKKSRRKKNRIRRPERLRLAKVWLEEYRGDDVLQDYCKHYTVDWRCAAIELQRLGVCFDPAYLRRLENAEHEKAFARKQRREARAMRGVFGYQTMLEAYLAEDYPALYAMECERDGLPNPFEEEKGDILLFGSENLGTGCPSADPAKSRMSLYTPTFANDAKERRSPERNRKEKRKRQHSGPRSKRMKRAGRLQSAVFWLKKYDGENILRGYCKHYGVDWRCAAIELAQLGVRLDPKYLKRREVAEQQHVLARKRRRETEEHEEFSESWYDYETPLEAYLDGDYAAMYDMECKENGWDPLLSVPEDLIGVWIGEDGIDEVDSLPDDFIPF